MHKKVRITGIVITLCSIQIFACCIPHRAASQKLCQELQQIVLDDQVDHKKMPALLGNKNELNKIIISDLMRRQRISEIAKKGGLKSGKDYLRAALIYQHGNNAKHYYQSYVYAKKAAELGEKNASNMSALAIDRYLISKGQKQLFGSQFLIKRLEHNLDAFCLCLQDVELSFPDNLRKIYSGYTLKDQCKITSKFYALPQCARSCAIRLKPTPKNTVFDLW